MEKKTILIVGGRTGIGRSLAETLLDQNHEVICTSRNPDLCSDLSAKVLKYDAEEPSKLELPEQIDGLVYCPGTIHLKPFHRLSKEDFLHEMQVNLFGAIDLLQQAMKSLKKSPHASVVLFSTVAVQTGMGFHSSIACSKGAIEGLTKSLAAEWAPKIRVNAVAPSLTDTPLASPLLENDAKRKVAEQRHPLKRVGASSEIAALVAFLLSEGSQSMTGQVIGIDGGLSSTQMFGA